MYYPWFIMYCDYWVDLMIMSIGKGFGILCWMNWLWIEGVRLDSWYVYLNFPNVYYRTWKVMMFGIVHLWWRCLCVIFVIHVPLPTLIYKLWLMWPRCHYINYYVFIMLWLDYVDIMTVKMTYVFMWSQNISSSSWWYVFLVNNSVVIMWITWCWSMMFIDKLYDTCDI